MPKHRQIAIPNPPSSSERGALDVVTLIKGGVYDDLSLTVGEALKKRSPVCEMPLMTYGT